MVAGRAAEQANPLHAGARLATPQEGDQGLAAGQRLHHRRALLLHAPPEGVCRHARTRAALDGLGQGLQAWAFQCRQLQGLHSLGAQRRKTGGQPQRKAAGCGFHLAGHQRVRCDVARHQPLPASSLRDPHQRLRAAIGPRQAAQVPALGILQVQGHALPFEFTLDHVAGRQIDAPGLAPTGSQDPCGRLARRQRARPCGQGLPRCGCRHVFTGMDGCAQQAQQRGGHAQALSCSLRHGVRSPPWPRHVPCAGRPLWRSCR